MVINSKVINNSVIVNMHAINDTVVHISFKGLINQSIIATISVVTLGATSTEKYIGIANQPTTLLLNLYETGGNYTVTGVLDGYLFEMVYNSNNPSSTRMVYHYYDAQSFSSDPTLSAIDLDYSRYFGVISLSNAAGSLIYQFAFYRNAGNYNSVNSNHNYHSANGIKSMSVVYSEPNTGINVYTTTSPANTLFLNKLNISTSAAIKEISSYSSQYKTSASKVNSNFVYATSQAGAESGATARQGVIWKRLFSNLDWTSYN